MEEEELDDYLSETEENYDEYDDDMEEEEEASEKPQENADIKPEQLLFLRSKGKNADRDMWDDSALISAWDSAVKEYQNFHSAENKPKLLKKDLSATTTTAAAAAATTATNSSGPSLQKPPNKTTSDQSLAENAIEKGDEKGDVVATETENARKPTFKKAEKSPLKNSSHDSGPSKKQKPLSTNKTSQSGEATDTPMTSNPDAYTQPSSNHYLSYADYIAQQNQYYQHVPYGGESSMSHGVAGNTDPTYPSMQQQPHPNAAAWGPWQGTPKVATPPPPPPPPGLLPDDETLANLLMAWYFSGYYTGLYQAQRRQ